MEEKDKTKGMKIHYKSWFYNRLGKKIYCNDHDSPDECKGILIEDGIVVNNLVDSQNKRGIRFFNQ